MRGLIADLRRIVDESEDDAERVTRAAACLEAFVESQPPIDPRLAQPGANTYARRLIHRDPHDRFVIVAMTWGPGQGTPVHDHGTWGVVGMLAGRIDGQIYQRTDDGSREGFADVIEVGCTVAGPGEVLPVVLPPHDEIHRLENPGPDIAIGLHLYGRDIERARRFQPEQGTWAWYSLSYAEDLSGSFG